MEGFFAHAGGTGGTIAFARAEASTGGMRRIFLLAIWCASAALSTVLARPFTVVDCSVENLFDLDGQAGSEEHQPAKYTPAHALTKLQNIAKVVGPLENGRGLDVLVLCELEVDQTPKLGMPNYDALPARYTNVKLEDMLGGKFDREVADLPSDARAYGERSS